MSAATANPTAAPQPAASKPATPTPAASPKPASQATAPAPAPEKPVNPRENMTLDDPLSELEGMSNIAPPEPDKKKEEKKEEPETQEEPEEKVEENKTEEQDDLLDPALKEKIDSPKKPEEKPVKNAKELRMALENTKTELKKLREEHEALKKTKETEVDRKTILEQLESEKKKREELEKELRFTSFEKTPEYKEKYQRPIEQAFASAYKEVAQLKIVDQEGNQTPATDKHFIALVQMPTDQAILQAKAWFGDAYPEVMAHRRHIMNLNDRRIEAIEEYKKNGSEREKQLSIEREQAQARYTDLYKNTLEEQRQKYPQLFAPIDGDDKGNEILQKGIALADMAFSPNPNVPPEQLVKIHATVRNKAAAFDRVAIQNYELKERIKQLEDDLKKFQESEPGSGDGETSEAKDTSQMSGAEELDMMANNAKK